MTELDRVHFQTDWPAGRPFQVIGLGLNAVDTILVLPRYPEHNTKLEIEQARRLGGGQTATASSLCARYGLKVRYLGRVGDDEMGRFSLADLKQEPMDVRVDIVPGASSQFAIILVDRPTGERTILWKRDSKLLFAGNGPKRELIVEGQLLHLDGHDQPASIRAARWAREAGMRVSLDIDKLQPGVEELLALTDFLIPTVSFVHQFSASADWREGLKVLCKATSGFVAATRGSQGAAAVWQDRIFEIPGYPVAPVDTTGAGDVFHGAFIYALFQNWSVRRCLQFANAAGALACTRYGARGGIPARNEVLRLVDG
ncbi:MAG: hypothetical protein HY315_09600 [Acidobacteria bacterium]|nr:hypothetical protein [Acidobacteriota bacterium]